MVRTNICYKSSDSAANFFCFVNRGYFKSRLKELDLTKKGKN